MKKFDLVVIGTGVGGSVAAHQCQQAGWDVAVIDKRPIGGTCALRGCDPKKILVGAAEIVDQVNRMQGKGVRQGSTIHWPELISFKRTFTDPVPKNREKAFQDAGISVYHGTASFTDESHVQVNDELLEGKYFLIASGAMPRPLKADGIDYISTSDDFLELEDLPKTLVFIGGGLISFEFAHIAARAGADVHILNRSARPLKNFDPDLVDLLLKQSSDLGIQVYSDTKLGSISKKDAHYIVRGDRGEEVLQWKCDMVVHGAGRVPELDDLHLEKGNIDYDKKGVLVNEYMQSTSNSHVYAAGDASSSPGLPLTPIASMESYIAAKNMVDGNEHTPDYSVMPSVVFTIPKLGIVGLTEEKARQQGYEIRVIHEDTSDWYTYKRTNEKYAAVKTVFDEKTGHLLGAHVLGSNADVLINHFATMIKFKLTASEVKKMIYAYPTSASDLGYLL